MIEVSTGVHGDKTSTFLQPGRVPWIERFLGGAGELYTALLWVNLDSFLQPLVTATSRVVHSVGKMWYIF